MTKRKALFLDRDGVINIDSGYVINKEDFIFVDGIFDFCSVAQKLGYVIVIVTNQAGIARGYYSVTDFMSLTRWVESKFAFHGIELSTTYFCPHHEDFTGVCNCRKPSPGMLIEAATDLNLDLAKSVLVGDKNSDMLAAKNAGVPVRWLIKAQSDEVLENATQVWENLSPMANALSHLEGKSGQL